MELKVSAKKDDRGLITVSCEVDGEQVAAMGGMRRTAALQSAASIGLIVRQAIERLAPEARPRQLPLPPVSEGKKGKPE